MGFSFENKRQVRLLIVLVVLIWLVFPLLFKAFMFWMGWVGVDLETFAAYGPVGDIYGSLNTLFTSATLAFVIYSTILQRQANKDARDAIDGQLQQARDARLTAQEQLQQVIDTRYAMAEQLEQARYATSVQLEQARNATDAQLEQAKVASDQQIENTTRLANIQLAQARESALQQLSLAQATLEAQNRQSQHTILTTKFYGLLNYKKENLNSIYIKKTIRNSDGTLGERGVLGVNVIEELADKFYEVLKDHRYSYLEFNRRELENDLIKISREFEYDSISKLIAYLHIYIDLIKLINDAKVSDDDKSFYKSVLSNSMTQHEQIFLFWITPIYDVFELENSEIFSMFASIDFLIPYAQKHHAPSHFKYNEWKKVFDNDEEFMVIEETPA